MSSLPTSRRVLREINSQARFEALHRDSECRRMRREVAEQEKLVREEEEAKKLLHPVPRRAFDQRWANSQPAAYAKKLRALEQKRQLQASSKEEEALKECSFAPRFVSKEGPRQRRILKARQRLEALAEEQRAWVLQLEALQSEEAELGGRTYRLCTFEGELGGEAPFWQDGSTEAFPCRSLPREAEERAVAERRCRIGVLQVLHELARLEAEALALASRATRHLPSHLNSSVPVATPAALARLAELCPAFDLDLLPRLRNEASRHDVPSEAECAWEVPGTLLRPPLPVPVTVAPVAGCGTAPDEARPWIWSWGPTASP